jgi:hypothetical protein
METNKLQVLRSQLDQANRNIESINSTSDGNRANKRLLTEQFEAKIKIFKEKYGIDVNAENLATVVANIIKEKQEAYNNVSAIISAIQSGDIDKANQLAGVSNEVPIQPVAQTIVQQEEPQVASQPVSQQPVVQPTVQPVVQPTVQPVVQPTVPPVTPTVAQQPTTPASTGIKVPVDLDDFEDKVVKTPVTMADLGNTGVTKEDKVNSFMQNLSASTETGANTNTQAGANSFASVINGGNN